MSARPTTFSLLVLSLVRGLGAVALRSMQEQGYTPSELLEHPSLLAEGCPGLERSALQHLRSGRLQAEAERIWAQCQRLGIEIIGLGEEAYPYLLGQCPDAPLVLYARGEANSWSIHPCLSVVGTRRSTLYGEEMTRRLVKGLASTSPTTTIVSGLALGIDIIAHRTAMAEGMPTIAVLAGGLDKVYPKVHRADALAILERGGAWLSETPPYAPIEAETFLRRNRLIAGLSSGTLVVEAGLRSGAMSTARLALAYDRSLFAVPGRATDPESAGCNSLLSTPCAILTTCASTIMDELAPGG